MVTTDMQEIEGTATEIGGPLALAGPGELPDPQAVGWARGRMLDMMDEIKMVVFDRDDLVQLTGMCLLAAEHLLMLGPPGTAKSMLMNEFAWRITDERGGGLSTFRLLMNKFTTPEMVLGPVSVQKLKNEDRYEHLIKGTLADSHLVLLDEIFKSSTAILNTLLMALNERQVDIGMGQRVDIPLITLLAASNELPNDTDALGAFLDRLPVRMQVGYLERGPFAKMMAAAVQNTQHRLYRQHAQWVTVAANGEDVDYLPAPLHNARMGLSELYLLQQSVAFIEIGPDVIAAIDKIRTTLSEKGIVISDRRWVQQLPLLQAAALLAGHSQVEEEELQWLKYSLWNKVDDMPIIAREIGRAANPATAKINELLERARTVVTSYEKAVKEAKNQGDEVVAASDAIPNIKNIRKELDSLISTLKGRTNDRTANALLERAQKADGQIREMLLKVSERMLAG